MNSQRLQQTTAAGYKKQLLQTPQTAGCQIGAGADTVVSASPGDPKSGPPTPSRAPVSPLHLEVRSAVGLSITHAHKIYFSGPLVQKIERQIDGQRPHKDEGWTEVWAQLGGTTLSIWDMREVREASRQGTEVPPAHLNVADAFVQVLSSVTVPATDENSRPTRYMNILTLNAAGHNLLLFSCPSTASLVSWASALRLSAWEKSRIEEIYTAHLIRITLETRDYPSTLVRGKLEGWAQIRVAGQTDWKRVWMSVCEGTGQSPQDTRNTASATSGQLHSTSGKRRFSVFSHKETPHLPAKPTIFMYSGMKPKERKKPILTITDVTQVFSVYPERPELIPRSTLIKVEGTFGDEEAAQSMETREGWTLVMPEWEPGGPIGNLIAEMLKWVVAMHDAFGLYGRPQSWTWNPRDRASLMFGYPVGPQKHHLFLNREHVETVDPRIDRTSIIRARLREMVVIDFMTSPTTQRNEGEDGASPPSFPPIPNVDEPGGSRSQSASPPAPQQGQSQRFDKPAMGRGPRPPSWSSSSSSCASSSGTGWEEESSSPDDDEDKDEDEEEEEEERGEPLPPLSHDLSSTAPADARREHQLADYSTTTCVDHVGNGIFGSNSGNITMINNQAAPARDVLEPIGKILDWLDGANFAKMLKSAWDQHMAGTGRWFFQCEEFRRFTEGAGTMLWGTGPPGAGKTFLSAAAVMELQTGFQARDGVAVAYAFLRFDEKHSSRNIIAGILSQLLQKRAWSIDRQKLEGDTDSRDPWRIIFDHHARGEHLGERDLLEVLRLAVGLFRRVFIVIDGLDEAEDATRDHLLTALVALQGANILITSRPLEGLAALYAPHALRVYITAQAEDIHLYVAERVRKSPKVQAILRISRDPGPTLLARLTDRIREMSNGMFLVAHLQMEAVLHNANTPASLFSTLEDLPTGVTDAYHHTLKRINAQSRGNLSLAKRLFIWLLHANRKLSAHDMQCALAVSSESSSYAPGDMVPISVAISACGGLVEVRENVDSGEESHASFAVADEVSFIRKCDYTHTLEFMRSITFADYPNPHEMLCTTCLAYLNAYPEAIDALRTAVRKNNEMSMEEVLLASGHWSEMLMYALENWGLHAREAAKAKPGGPLHPHIVKFLMHCADYPVERRWLLGQHDHRRHADASTAITSRSNDRRLTVVSGLHLAVMYDLPDVICSKVLSYPSPPHGSDKKSQTHRDEASYMSPLSLATVRRNANMCGVILEAYPEAVEGDGWRALVDRLMTD